LPIIEKIPTVEQIGMYRGMGGVSKYLYTNKEKLCGLINNWKNIKTIYFPVDRLEINIKNGMFTLNDDKGQQQYSSCSDLIDGIKKSEDFY
jgi:archaellum component FlaC